jgi:hypothetical protein
MFGKKVSEEKELSPLGFGKESGEFKQEATECPRCGLFVHIMHKIRRLDVSEIKEYCIDCCEIQRLENLAYIDNNR